MLRKLIIPLCVLAYLLPLGLYAYIHSPGGHDGRVHIRYMAWGNPEQQSTDYAVLKKFEELHPHIKVDFILGAGGDYTRKLSIMLTSNTEPDVFKMDLYYLPKYFPYGYFLPLNELDAQDPTFTFDDFYPITKNELTYKGEILGLNTLFGGKIIYYNKTLFSQAGLPDPYEQYKKGEWTTDAFLKAARELTKRDAGGLTTQFGVKLDTNDLWWILWAYGGDIIDKNHNVYLDQPASIAGLTFYANLLHKYRVMPLPGEDSGGVFSFESGKLGMFSEFAGASPRFRKYISRFEWDIVPVPSGPAGRFCLMKGNGLIISSRSKHIAESWELIKYLNSPAGEMAYAGPALRRAIPTRFVVPAAENKTGRLINREDYLASGGKPPYNTDTFLELHASAHQLPVTPQWQKWQQEATKYLDKLHRGEITAKECAVELAGEIRKVLGPPMGPPLVTVRTAATDPTAGGQ